MNKNFLYELYEATQEFQNWEISDNYDSFNEAESDFFDFIDKAKSKGMVNIGRGGDRDVYRGGSIAGSNNVVKIARESLIQNENAVEIWKELPSEAKNHVAPIHSWGDGYEWIVQSEASGRGDIEVVSKNLSEYGYYVSDMNGTNIGKYNGNDVLIDLGQLHK